MAASREQAIANLQKAIESRPDRTTNDKHGVFAVKDGKPVPDRYPHVRDAIATLKGELYSEEALLDDPNPNPKVKVLIDSICRAVACEMLAYDDLFRRGFLIEEEGKEPRLNPVVKVLASFSNTARLGLVSLGLERKTRPAESLQEYIQKNYGEAGDGHGTGSE